MKVHALKFVPFRKIEDHFRQGWMASIPNAPMHHHYYGIELKWICSCPVPGLKTFTTNRNPQTGEEHERAGA